MFLDITAAGPTTFRCGAREPTLVTGMVLIEPYGRVVKISLIQLAMPKPSSAAPSSVACYCYGYPKANPGDLDSCGTFKDTLG